MTSSCRRHHLAVANNIKVSTTSIDGNFHLVVDGSSSNFFDCPQVILTVILPPMGLVEPDVVIDITNGKVTFEDLPVVFGSVSAVTTSGKIEVSTLTANYINLETTNGQVDGKFRLTKAPCYLNLVNTNGDIEVEKLTIMPAAALASCDIKIETTNGDIDYESVEGFSGSFDIQTTNGDANVSGSGYHIKTDEDNHKAGTRGVGTMRIHGKSTNGDASVYFM